MERIKNLARKVMPYVFSGLMIFGIGKSIFGQNADSLETEKINKDFIEFVKSNAQGHYSNWGPETYFFMSDPLMERNDYMVSLSNGELVEIGGEYWIKEGIKLNIEKRFYSILDSSLIKIMYSDFKGNGLFEGEGDKFERRFNCEPSRILFGKPISDYSKEEQIEINKELIESKKPDLDNLW